MFQEEEMRKEGGKKYAHLNDALHVYVEAQAEMTDGYRRLAHAVAELKKFLVPVCVSFFFFFFFFFLTVYFPYVLCLVDHD